MTMARRSHGFRWTKTDGIASHALRCPGLRSRGLRVAATDEFGPSISTQTEPRWSGTIHRTIKTWVAILVCFWLSFVCVLSLIVKRQLILWYLEHFGLVYLVLHHHGSGHWPPCKLLMNMVHVQLDKMMSSASARAVVAVAIAVMLGVITGSWLESPKKSSRAERTCNRLALRS